MKPEAYLHRLARDGEKSLRDRMVLCVLSGLESMYGLGVKFTFRREWGGRQKLPIPVISVGNITAGGTGKTPFTLKLAQLLRAAGKKPAVLTRGYRGGAEKMGAVVSDRDKVLLDPACAGDEPYLMARRLPGVPVLAGRDRCRSALEAEKMGADVLILDDGFQYWKLARDLDIVLIDSTDPFGGGHMLPRGFLREPLKHLERADFFVLTKADQAGDVKKKEICDILHRYRPDAPVIEAGHHPSFCVAYTDWSEGHTKPLPQGSPEEYVFLLSGIGSPDGFRRTAEEAGLRISGSAALDDHHAYTAEDLRKAAEQAGRCGAKAIVITEKDAVKMLNLSAGISIPVYVLGIDICLPGNGEKTLRLAWEGIV